MCPLFQLVCIYMLVHLANAFIQTDLKQFIHWWWWLPCKVLTGTSGAVSSGSVSCSRTLWHADQGNQTSDHPMIRRWLCPWATDPTFKITFSEIICIAICMLLRRQIRELLFKHLCGTLYCQKYSLICLDSHMNLSDIPFLIHGV